MKVFRRVVGVGLAAAAGIFLVTAILTLTHVGNCGDIGEPACPSSVNAAGGEIVAGVTLLVAGSIMTVGAGILVCLFVGGVYAWIRAVNGGYGLLSSDGVVVLIFLTVPVLLFVIWVIVTIVAKPADAKPADAKPADAPPDAARGGMIAELERLAALHRDGALTAEEYTRAKERLIG